MDPLEKIRAEYRYAVAQLQRKFQEENKAFFETFKEEIKEAYEKEDAIVSPVVADAAIRLAKSQQLRLKKAAEDAMAETLLYQQEFLKAHGEVEVN